MSLWADRNSRCFTLLNDSGYSPEAVEHFICDVALPKLLALDGDLVLHGGAIQIHASTVGFIAPSGRGKSTLTASLHNRGFRLMGDDAIRLRKTPDGYLAQRLYPSLRLYPDSLEKIISPMTETTAFAEYTDKRRVNYEPGPQQAKLQALFILGEPDDKVSVRVLSEAETCMAIIANSFAFDVDDKNETIHKFKQASELSQGMRVRELRYPRDYTRLPEVHAAIFDTVNRLQKAT